MKVLFHHRPTAKLLIGAPAPWRTPRALSALGSVKSSLVVAAVVLLMHAHSSPAVACGSTPSLVRALLPLAGATDVPLDAALIAASNSRDSTIELRKVSERAAYDAGAGDAGQSALDLDTQCNTTLDGALCVARPQAALEPESTYEWRVARLVVGDGTDLVSPVTEWQRFTTTDTTLDSSGPAIAVELTTNDVHINPECGGGHIAKLQFSAAGLQSPVVVNIAGVTPSYIMLPLTLTADAASAEFIVYSPPTCITPEVIDVTGVSTLLDELCLADILPPTYYDETGAVVPEPAPMATEPAPTGTTPTGGPVAPDAPNAMTPSAQPGKSEQSSGVGLSAVDADNSAKGCALAPARGRDHTRSAPAAVLAFAALSALSRRSATRQCVTHLVNSATRGA